VAFRVDRAAEMTPGTEVRVYIRPEDVMLGNSISLNPAVGAGWHRRVGEQFNPR
jgi:hypothetical protein